jgi:hypothetical protein
MKKENTHPNRESWLHAAMNLLRSHFDKLGYQLPENIRMAIGFTSGGKRGSMEGEVWHPPASADSHYEIFISADMSDPLDVLATLVHELIHVLLPPEAKHGKAFRDIALRVGLEGPMRHTFPTPILKERLQTIAASLGPLPHAKLNFRAGSEAKKKSGAHFLKAECGTDGCGYNIRIIPKWAKAGLPVCPVNKKHGVLTCVLPEDNEETTATLPDVPENGDDTAEIISDTEA